MNIPRIPHNWQISVQKALAVQRSLAKKVVVQRPAKPLRFICGIDAAYSTDGKQCIAGVVLWDVLKQQVIEQHTAINRMPLPYIPGLLTFREGPAVVKALRKLNNVPDVLLFDGQGIAHPRRLGIASHMGVLLNMPAIGCAKSRLVGTYVEPEPAKGSFTELVYDNEVIGAVLRTRAQVNPVFISIGHLIDLQSAVGIVLRCAVKYRLPEPTRLADQLVGRAKKRWHCYGR